MAEIDHGPTGPGCGAVYGGRLNGFKASPKLKDVTGLRSGRLVVREYAGGGLWLCDCDCGGTRLCRGSLITSGRAVGCTCARKLEWEPITLDGGCVAIPLSRGRRAVIDAADLPLVREYNWCLKTAGHLSYAISHTPGPDGPRGRRLYLHRVILGAGPDQMIDHKDGDGLNNRRDNIRFCTAQQNLFNTRISGGTSRFKGVRHVGRRWQAKIMAGGVSRYLGSFATEEEAARAYDREAAVIQGEFMRPNLPG